MIISDSDLRGFWVWRRGSHYTELLRPDGKWQRVVEGLDYLPTVLKTGAKREAGCNPGRIRTGGKAMAQQVVHGADPWGWERMPRSELVALACMSPHSCEVLDCPGPVNKRKLEAFEGLLEALKDLVALYAGSLGHDPTFVKKGLAALAKVSPQAPGPG